MARERFGRYLLLKKLSEDPLGEVFRAGRVGGDGGLDQVVLLRTFNGSAIESRDLGQQLNQRRAMQQLLRSPNLAHGVDAGEFEGVPFVAYDYVSGRDLDSLREQASRRNHPLPVEHALLITERLALGLSVAFGTRFANEQIVHGFLLPTFVLLSNEGENRLTGFEVGPLLRATPSNSALWQHYGRYLPPEARRGGPPLPTDDVYSLGVILLELTTGRAFDGTQESLRAGIQAAAAHGLPTVGSLIEQSLLPAPDRIPNVTAWHQKLSELVLSRQVSSTPFHLAFYMHNLFRDDIERESQEIERERSIDLSSDRLAAATPSRPSVAPVSSEVPLEHSSAPLARGQAGAAMSASGRRPSGALIGGIAAAVLLLGAGGFFAWKYLINKGPSAEEVAGPVDPKALSTEELLDTTATAAGDLVDADGVAAIVEEGAPAETTPAAPAADPKAVDPQELLRQIDRLVADRTKALEQNLRNQYDDELNRLRNQVTEAEKSRETERTRADLLVKEQANAAGITSAATAAPAPATTQPVRTAQGPVGAQSPAGSLPATTSPLTTEQAVSQTNLQPGSRPIEGATTPANRTPAVRQPAVTTPAAAPAERVTLGQLVTPGTGVIHPKLLEQPQPSYPIAAKRLRKEAVVELNVLVDENGEVLEVKPQSKAGFGFDDAAIAAARRSKYRPATKNGVRVKMWVPVRIQFQLD